MIGDYDFPMEVFDAYGANIGFWDDNDCRLGRPPSAQTAIHTST